MNHVALLFELKSTLLLNALKKLVRRSRVEFFVLLLILFGAAGGLFLFFYHSFQFFQGQKPFGPILIDECLYLFNFALFIMLLISSGVSAYSSLYRSNEIPFLITHPFKWTEIFFLKLVEAFWFSSWSFLFIAIPFLMAYGIGKNVQLMTFFLIGLGLYIPFVILTSTLGTIGATVTVWLLPSRRARRIALIFVITVAAILFFRAQPQMIREQGSIAGILSGYLPHVAFAKSALIPSSWVTRGILAFSQTGLATPYDLQDGIFYLLLTLSNMLFFLIPCYSVAGTLYPKTFYSANDHGTIEGPRHAHTSQIFEKILDRLPWPSRPALAFLEKDVKTFARNPSEWSQLIIFFGLLLLYFVNLKNLEFHVLKPFWKNLVFVLNTLGTYIVLSSFNMRFVFPMLSLEGSRAWLIGLVPMRFSSLLLVKFLLGTFISMMLSTPLVYLSGWLLEVSTERILYTTGLGFFVCVALTGLSVGLGAKFPNFKSNNPSEIISGLGGSFLLMTHLIYLTIIGVFLLLSKESHVTIFGTLAAGSLLIGALSLKIGIRALKNMEF